MPALDGRKTAPYAFLGACLCLPDVSVYSQVPAMAMTVPTSAWVVIT